MLLQNTLTPMMFRQIVQKAQKIAGQVRIELGKRLDLLEKNVY